MASILANLPVALIANKGPQNLRGRNGDVAFPVVFRRQDRPKGIATVIKAVGEGSESSSLSIVKSVQNVWDNPEDRLGLIGLWFAGVVAVWASINLISAVDKLPLIPAVMEFIGIVYSAWFVYRYLLFKPTREELFQIINSFISSILSQ